MEKENGMEKLEKQEAKLEKKKQLLQEHLHKMCNNYIAYCYKICHLQKILKLMKNQFFIQIIYLQKKIDTDAQALMLIYEI